MTVDDATVAGEQRHHNGTDDRRRLPALSCWTRDLTDRLLSCENQNENKNDDERDNVNGSSPPWFVLLDNVSGSQSSVEPEERATHPGLFDADRLTEELGFFLERLAPARTTGDAMGDELFELLRSVGHGKVPLPDPREADPPVSSVRGDRSTFVSREQRQRPSFATLRPHLHRLIQAVSNTFENEFHGGNNGGDSTNKGGIKYGTAGDNGNRGHSIRLDLSKTSVQVAEYPGDSKSGYPRHCDREKSCHHELPMGATSNKRSSSSSSKNIEPPALRLLTAIYYLTDEDWDGELDGGALRMFCPSGNGRYVDVVPHRDRMVVFRSDRVEHQVLPSHRRSRLAITIWFYGTLALGTDPSPPTLRNDSDPVAPAGVAESRDTRPPPMTPAIEAAAAMKRNADEADDSSAAVSTPPSIFVSIASFRDSETRPTLQALFSRAKHPHRIVVGIVAQLVDGEAYDEAIWESIVRFSQSPGPLAPEPHQIRAMRMHARDATGPCYARGLCQSLYRGEDYVLQIDSHMRFRDHWDDYLVRTIVDLRARRLAAAADGNEAAQADKILLTAYPVGYTLPNEVPSETRGTYLVPWKFDTNGMLRQRGRLLRRDPVAAPDPTSARVVAHRQYLYAGGFNFGPGRVVREVPYDTNGLHHLFFGEEPSMAVRLFTHGYDLFAPAESACYHLWSRAHRPPPPAGTTDPLRRELRDRSLAAVQRQLLGGESPPTGTTTTTTTTHGLGTVRTASEFAERLGVDFRRRAFVREGWEWGSLSPGDFVGGTGEDSGEEPRLPNPTPSHGGSEWSSLDRTAKDLIGAFLRGLQDAEQ